LEDRLTPAASALDVWTRRFDVMEARVKSLASYANSTDSAVLAWSESYVLSGYLAMYEATRDTKYLDKFAQQSNVILDHASDPNHTGYLGWGTFKYSVSLARNGDFEAADRYDGSLPSNWVRFQSTSSTAFLDDGQHRTGYYSATVNTNPVAGWQILETSTFNSRVSNNRAYEPNSLYQLSFSGKTNGSAAGGRVEIYDNTSGTILAGKNFTSSKWATYAINFQSPKIAGHDLQIRLTHMNYRVPGGSASFDHVVVRQYAEFVVHEARIAAPLAQFAAYVQANPSLRAAYGAAADRFAGFIRTEILPRWDRDFRAIGATGGTYVFPDDGSSTLPRNSVPNNQNLAMADAFLWMSIVDKDATLADRAQRLGNTFKGQLHLVGSRYVWSYSGHLLSGDYSPPTAPEDISHGNVDIGFVVDAYRAGFIFTSTDIKRFAATLTGAMWNRSLGTALVSRRVDGSAGLESPNTVSEWAMLGLPGLPSGSFNVVRAILAKNSRWARSGPAGLLAIARMAQGSPRPQASNDPGAPAAKPLPLGPSAVVPEPIWLTAEDAPKGSLVKVWGGSAE
jgi:hypothetical protein